MASIQEEQPDSKGHDKHTPRSTKRGKAKRKLKRGQGHRA